MDPEFSDDALPDAAGPTLLTPRPEVVQRLGQCWARGDTLTLRPDFSKLITVPTSHGLLALCERVRVIGEEETLEQLRPLRWDQVERVE